MEIRSIHLAVGAAGVGALVAWTAYAVHADPEPIVVPARHDAVALDAARLQLVAPRAPALRVDGRLGEWSEASFVPLTIRRSPTGDVYDAPVDDDWPPARVALYWRDHALFLAVEVEDDVHSNREAGDAIWKGDCLQVAFDVRGNPRAAREHIEHIELGWALTDRGVVNHRWFGEAPEAVTETSVAVERAERRTTYELRISASELGLAHLADGDSLGFSIAVNDDDGRGWSGALELTPGILHGKDPDAFGLLTLVGSASADEAERVDW